jgi:formylglycine-generating enzyme required for sulfatase activity
VQVAAFMMSKYEVTQGQWKAVMGNNPSRFKECGDNCPVENVSWNDAQAYVVKLNAKTGGKYRLPSEAEWEYAARAGSTGRWSFGGDEKELGQHAWYDANSKSTVHPVGLKGANKFGLHDMYGNVWEWVEDCFHDNYNGAPEDGSAWIKGCENGAARVLRGGGGLYLARGTRSAFRNHLQPVRLFDDTGFRLAFRASGPAGQ